MAGLRLMFGMDFNEDAGATWHFNFPQAELYEMWADEFIHLPDKEQRLTVDILHLSLPCQFYSPAHTRAGKDDEMNTATSFSVSGLLRKCRPRIATLEETAGLVTRHREYFHGIVEHFTALDYSVSWQLVKFQDWGLPQSRHRLIMVASWYSL